MHLENRPLKFSTITHHASVTQCLGSIGAHVWYLGVAKPSILDDDSKENKDNDNNKSNDVVQSQCGHFYVPPAVDEVCVFRISGPKFVKLNRGTWHAGPLFKPQTMDFYNLELSNTNVSFCLSFFLSFTLSSKSLACRPLRSFDVGIHWCLFALTVIIAHICACTICLLNKVSVVVRDFFFPHLVVEKEVRK